MTIIPVRHAKKLYLPLLLLADEQEDMIDKYLERGDMYVLDDEGIKAECVVTDEGCGILKTSPYAPSLRGKDTEKRSLILLSASIRAVSQYYRSVPATARSLSPSMKNAASPVPTL